MIIDNYIFIIIAVILVPISFIGGFVVALVFSTRIFDYHRKQNNIKKETFPFLRGLDNIAGEDEKKRVEQAQKEDWNKKIDSISSQHL